jgi:hypothetical protein
MSGSLSRPLVCDSCGWTGTATTAPPHPRLDAVVCPDCWAEGFETAVRERLGGLMEALAPGDPAPRVPKAMVDWSEEEWAIAGRIARAKEAHERSDVLLKTNIEGRKQHGFDFMREEFKVKARSTS